jgi:hypothetical protein
LLFDIFHLSWANEIRICLGLLMVQDFAPQIIAASN